jgi:release factor glutamine methyltransferase
LDEPSPLPGETRPASTIREALDEATSQLVQSGMQSPRRDAELLLLHIAKLSRAELIAHPERVLSAEESSQFQAAIARRKLSEPIQYITGEREFYGLRFLVTPDVLIPRPETEHLVEAALNLVPAAEPFQIIDVGTGSGAIAIALAVARPQASIFALDISPAALEVAKTNAAAHAVGSRIVFRESDLLAGVTAESCDMVVSNPPYIADHERESLDLEVAQYEPASALFAGPTGLEIYQRLIPQAAQALRRGGWLLMETGEGQDSQLRLLLEGWSNVSFVADLQGIPRICIAQRVLCVSLLANPSTDRSW